MTVAWQRYIAVGDSMTEGLWDPYDSEGQELRGWADRLATALSAQRIADGGARLEYANLAVRGRLLGPILDVQLPEALAAGADLVSVVGGGNDLLRPNADPDRLAARLERAVRTARRAGAHVLLATGTDPRRAPLLAAIRPKVAVYNAHIWSIARRTGADVVDVWGLRALQDWRMWAEDRIHLSPEGHHRVAQAALVALGLAPEDPEWARPLPAAEPAGVRDQWRTDAAWLRQEVYPWARRHLRGRSSGDGRSAKRPDAAPLAAVEPAGPVDPAGPAEPVGPVEPTGPAEPVGPVEPTGPAAPAEPAESAGPVEPARRAGDVRRTGSSSSSRDTADARDADRASDDA